MELFNLLRTLKRWLWLIVALVLVTGVMLTIRLQGAEPVYEAIATLQLSIPEQEDVAAFDSYRYSSLRDEVTVARNNLAQVFHSDVVYNRVIQQLGLNWADARYSVAFEPVRDVDFVRVVVQARAPEQAALLANTHVQKAIQYYGELRAKPADAAKDLLAEQLAAVEQEFRAAENAFVEFRTQNRVTTLEDEIAAQQRLLGELSVARDARLLEGADTSAIEEVDALIAQRQEQLDRLMALEPMYRSMEQRALEARSNYQHMLTKYFEAEIKAEALRSANFIQVVADAQPRMQPVSESKKFLVLGLAGSLGFGILLAFLLDYIFNYQTQEEMLSYQEVEPIGDAETVLRSVNSTKRTEKERG